MRRHLFPLVCVLAIGCSGTASPRDQWVVELRTDASVPEHGDRLLLELLDADGQLACAATACRRVLGVGSKDAWPVSFGIEKTTGGELRVRARLFRFDDVDGEGMPLGKALIDRVGRLPRASGVTRVSFPLPMACFGVAPDLAARKSCDPASGALGPEPELESSANALEPGDYAASMRGTCPSSPESGRVCIPGGVFLLGSRRAGDLTDIPSAPERLVRVRSLWVDVAELSVAEFATVKDAVTSLPSAWDPDPTHFGNSCTYGGPAGGAAPLNCVSFELAKEICAARQMRLPSEVEWEYVASNAGRETQFPWGDDPDACGHAIVARGRANVVASASAEDPRCRSQPDGSVAPWGPVAGGDPDDVNDFGVANLGGNLAEWVVGSELGYDECWDPNTPLLTEPVCESATYAALRGGDWASLEAFARSATRRVTLHAPNDSVGVRCVSDAE